MRRFIIGKHGLRAAIIFAALLLTLMLVPFVQAFADPCVQGGTPSGCADVKLNDPTLVADFYVGETLAATGVNSARLSVPASATVKVEARNVRDNSAEFGDVYVFTNASTNVTLSAGQTRAYTLTPKKTYLKGFLTLTCDIGHVQAGEGVVCRPMVDGTTMGDIAPGGKVTYNLLPGKHNVHVDLVGEQAGRWNKTANDHSATITAGRTSSVASKFVKRGLLTITLSQPGVTADLYVDDVLIASQAVTAEMWVTSGASHKVEARNVTDPAANGVYKWKDARSSTSIGAGQARTVKLNLLKEYLVGFLDIKCELEGYSNQDVQCSVTDGETLLGIQSPGQEVRYNLAKGSHALVVSLGGKDAVKWELIKTYSVTIRLGIATKSTAKFKLAPAPNPAYTGKFSSIDIAYLKTVFQKGKGMGNRVNRFSKVGDSESHNTEYLQNFDTGYYGLGDYQYLSGMLTQFKGSFLHLGQAVKVGYPAAALLDPIWADPKSCGKDESPLACEIRLYKPAVILILIRTQSQDVSINGSYHQELRAIVQYCLDKGVIPVLSTAPYWYPPLPDVYAMNDTIRLVAAEKRIPLWDLWVTTETLPNRGVRDHGGHTSFPDNGRVAYFEDATMTAGMTRRNLEALEILHLLYTQVMK